MFSSVTEATSGFLLVVLRVSTRWGCCVVWVVPSRLRWLLFLLFFLLIRYGADHPLSPWKRSRDGCRGELMLAAKSTFDFRGCICCFLLVAGSR